MGCTSPGQSPAYGRLTGFPLCSSPHFAPMKAHILKKATVRVDEDTFNHSMVILGWLKSSHLNTRTFLVSPSRKLEAPLNVHLMSGAATALELNVVFNFHVLVTLLA